MKKGRDLKAHLGFNRKYRGKTKTHLLETCFNEKGRFIKIMEFATNQKTSLVVVPEGEEEGWKALLEAFFSVQSLSTNNQNKASKVPQSREVLSRGSRTFAKILVEGGPRRGALMSVGKWERAIICDRTKLGIGWMQEGKAHSYERRA